MAKEPCVVGGHAWQGVMARGHTWQGDNTHGNGGVHGKGGACVQEKRPLKRAVHILLECILV